MPSDAQLVSMTRIRQLIDEGFAIVIEEGPGGYREARLEKAGEHSIGITLQRARFGQAYEQSKLVDKSAWIECPRPRSTHIYSYRYRESDGTLEVTFRKDKVKGATYRYLAVRRHAFDAFEASDSLTTFLNHCIAKEHEYSKVPEEPTHVDLTKALAESLSQALLERSA